MSMCVSSVFVCICLCLCVYKYVCVYLCVCICVCVSGPIEYVYQQLDWIVGMTVMLHG